VDTDGDGILGEWYSTDENSEIANETPEDIIDLLPDVAVGRLAVPDAAEVQEMVNKIITYETLHMGLIGLRK